MKPILSSSEEYGDSFYCDSYGFGDHVGDGLGMGTPSQAFGCALEKNPGCGGSPKIFQKFIYSILTLEYFMLGTCHDPAFCGQGGYHCGCRY